MNKKLLFSLALCFLLIGGVTASWLFEYNNEIQGEVKTTGSKLEVIVNFADYDLNTSNGNVTHHENLTLYNKKNSKMMLLNLTINKTLTEPLCPNYENDCVVEFWNTTSNIPSGGNIWMTNGYHNYTLKTMCVEDSCGQNITTIISLYE